MPLTKWTEAPLAEFVEEEPASEIMVSLSSIVRRLNELLDVDREGISRILRFEHEVSGELRQHAYLRRRPGHGALMTGLGLLNSLLPRQPSGRPAITIAVNEATLNVEEAMGCDTEGMPRRAAIVKDEWEIVAGYRSAAEGPGTKGTDVSVHQLPDEDEPLPAPRAPQRPLLPGKKD